ncbi:hypothetical protein SAMN02910315_01933 [Methanobrevibacter millerae]|uniref:Uncharacterized protein n=2 Tax=Methanobrevibacter millerae TaxID=230361 RepID=A0A1G5X5W8_9EURY|nr:hypothetical protein SAMN02910315_01933 [Methanobrevibacter millerae]
MNMEYEGFRLRSFIFQDKEKIHGKRFSLQGDSNATYDFNIHGVGHNALDVTAFCNYEKIARNSNRMEKDLHYLIDYRAKLASTLASEANNRAYRIYEEKIKVNIEDIDYTFIIDGVGPKAIKMTCQVTYDEIATSHRPLESYLKNLISSTYRMDDPELISKIDREWAQDFEEKKKRRQQTIKDEEERRRKREELEEFLKS